MPERCADGVLHLPALEAVPTDGIPRRTRDLLFKAIGMAQFADLIMEVDARSGFSEVLLARKARDANELVALYGALIAHGTEIDAKGVAAMIPQVDAAAISTAMRMLEMPGRVLRANERVVEFQRTHLITELWGAGQRASSDSMSLDTSPHLFYARVDPRRRGLAPGKQPATKLLPRRRPRRKRQPSGKSGLEEMNGASTRDVARVVAEGIPLSDLAIAAMDQ